MNNPIVIAIISAGLSAFVTCTFQMINKFIEIKKKKRRGYIAKRKNKFI